MRAVAIQDGLTFTTDYPQPQPQPGQALIRISRAGICNTDLELVKGYMGYRGVLGHEFVGTVVGGETAWAGQRVVGEINVACGQCDLCLEGIPSQCRNRVTVGINRHDGAMADYLALTVENLHSVPPGISDDHATFVEPLAAALQNVRLVHISPSQVVILIGAGKLGMLVAQVLRLTGARVKAVVRRLKQAEMLERWGIEPVDFDSLPRKRAHVVVDCTGTSEGFSNALELVRPQGTIVLKSTYVGLPQADLTRVVVDEIRVIGSRCGPFDAALRLLEQGLIDLDPLIEARYPLNDALKAFEHAAQPGMLKVLLDCAG